MGNTKENLKKANPKHAIYHYQHQAVRRQEPQ